MDAVASSWIVTQLIKLLYLDAATTEMKELENLVLRGHIVLKEEI